MNVDNINLPNTLNGDSPTTEAGWQNNNILTKLLNMSNNNSQNGGDCGGTHIQEYNRGYQTGGTYCNNSQHGAGCGCDGDCECVGECTCGCNDNEYYSKYMKYKAKFMKLKSVNSNQSGGANKKTYSNNECYKNIKQMFLQ